MPEVNFNLLNPGAELYSGPQVTLDPVKAYETAQAKQQSNMLAQLYAKHYDPQTGDVNYNSLIGEAAQSGLGKYIPDIMGDAQKQSQSMAEIAQKKALADQEKAAAAKYQDEIRREKIKEMATESYGRFRGVKDIEGLRQWHKENPELEGTNKAERTAKLEDELARTGYEATRARIEQSLQDITGIKPAESKYYEQNLGTTTQVISIDPTTGKATVVPGSVANIAPSASEKLAREKFEAEKEKGVYSPETIDFLAQMYNQTGTLPTLGLGASGVKMQIIDRARQIGTAGGVSTEEAAGNVVQSKQTKAAEQQTLKAFTAGLEARRVTANNTAINHLETMDKLVDDLTNKDTRIVNKAANAFAKETGSAAPTNFDAAKQIVAAEVIKAVVQNGGGVTERQEAAEQFARANSPAQLRGVIKTYKDLLGGQLQSLKQQYEFGTKRKDFDQRLTPNTRKLLTPAADNKPDLSKLSDEELLKQLQGG